MTEDGESGSLWSDALMFGHSGMINVMKCTRCPKKPSISLLETSDPTQIVYGCGTVSKGKPCLGGCLMNPSVCHDFGLYELPHMRNWYNFISVVGRMDDIQRRDIL